MTNVAGRSTPPDWNIVVLIITTFSGDARVGNARDKRIASGIVGKSIVRAKWFKVPGGRL